MGVKSRFAVLVACAAVWVGFLTILPYVVHTFHPAYAGLTVTRDKDYGNYYSRLQRALDGYPEEAANAITAAGSGIKGMQTAGVEQFVGTVFGWTGISAAPLAVILTAIFTAMLFGLFVWLFREIGFDERWSLGMTVVLFAVMGHVLSRMPHPGWSFLPAIGSLIAFIRLWRRPGFNAALLAGLLLGVLPFLYFWHWTFVWAAVGCVVLFALGARPEDRLLVRHPWTSLLLAAVTLVVALPFLLKTAALMADPLYPEVAVRASFLYERTPESWPRTILLIVQFITLASLWKTYRTDRSYLLALGMLGGIVLAMHQNVLHAKILMFASHFYPQLLLATIVAGAWVLTRQTDLVRRAVVAGIAAVFLLAGAWDYAFMHAFFVPSERDFREQHLLGPIALLRDAPPTTVLTDATTGRTLTAWTRHGIVYTTHARFLFISDAEMAERFCVTELFTPVPDPFRSLYIEYNHVLDSPEMRLRERSLVTEACDRVKKNPTEYLEKYGVTHVLWNAIERPDWVVPEEFPLEHVASGTGWTLWMVE